MKKLLQKINVLLLLLVAANFAPINEAEAGKCGPEFVNPVTDIAWQCIFPIRIGGLIQANAGAPEDPDTISSPVCVCGLRVGVTMSFWEPSRMIDTVSDPMCFMAIGQQMANPAPGQLGGGLMREEHDVKAFQQMHYYIFPAWAILDMFYDFPCIDNTSFDIAMMTEVLPHWNNELTGLLLNPEAVLFGNPAAQMACAADAVAALHGMPINELFWCQGSWPSVYPLSGSITATDYVEANAGIAGRGIFMMGRVGMLWDPGITECGAVPVPIWRKRNIRLQLAKPVRDYSCQPIGRSGLLWTHMKNPPMAGDNFAWMMFRKVKCCVSY